MNYKIKIQRPNSIKLWLWLSFLISIIFELLVEMEIISDTNLTKIIQYVIILSPIVFRIYEIFWNKLNKNSNYYFDDEMRWSLKIAGIILLLSLYKSMSASKFAFSSIMEIIQILLPFLFAYVIINSFTESEIDLFMKIALFITVVAYIYDKRTELLNFSNYLMISVINSFSPFENSTYAEIASGLAAYFIYNRKRMPWACAVCVILNLLIFKRVFILMTIALLILSFTQLPNVKISQKIIWLNGIIWVFIISGFYYMYLPENYKRFEQFLHINFANFTMARIYRLWYVLEHNFESYGLGSTSEYLSQLKLDYIGYEFEMDWIRILFELGIVAIVCLVFLYLKTTKGYLYSVVLINFCFLNLLMANGIVRYWGWSMRIITLTLIGYTYNENKSSVVRKKQRKSGK